MSVGNPAVIDRRYNSGFHYILHDSVEGDGRVEARPKCQSADIVLESLDAEPVQGGPQTYNWICDACGHQWKHEGLEQLA